MKPNQRKMRVQFHNLIVKTPLIYSQQHQSKWLYSTPRYVWCCTNQWILHCSRPAQPPGLLSIEACPGRYQFNHRLGWLWWQGRLCNCKDLWAPSPCTKWCGQSCQCATIWFPSKIPKEVDYCERNCQVLWRDKPWSHTINDDVAGSQELCNTDGSAERNCQPSKYYSNETQHANDKVPTILWSTLWQSHWKVRMSCKVHLQAPWKSSCGWSCISTKSATLRRAWFG